MIAQWRAYWRVARQFDDALTGFRQTKLTRGTQHALRFNAA